MLSTIRNRVYFDEKCSTTSKRKLSFYLLKHFYVSTQNSFIKNMIDNKTLIVIHSLVL